MKKKEIRMVLGFLIVMIVCFLVLQFSSSHKKMIHIIDDSETILLSFPLEEDGYYEVEGNVGNFGVEVKDGKWRAINVDCPNHDCEKMGWSSKDIYFPIICLPNRLWVMLDE